MKVKQLERRRVFNGKVIQVDEVDLDFGNGKRATFELVEFAVVTGVSALPIEGDSIYLIRHYQAGIDEIGYSLPTGGLEEGEDPNERMQEELMEELGMRADRLTLLTRVHSLPGYIGSEAGYIFLAQGLREESREGDEAYEIEVVKMTVAEAMDKVKTGEIIDGRTMLALLYYQYYVQK